MAKGRLLLLAALALASAMAADAHFAERTDSLWGFVSRSDLVVVGRVVVSEHFEEKGHTPAPGAIRLQVDQVLHGSAPKSEIGILLTGMHQPRYAGGERVLVFVETRDGVARSLQSALEKVAVENKDAPVLGVVKRYAAIAALRDPKRRAAALEKITLEMLASPDRRIHEDAIYDLSRRTEIDAAIGRGDVAALGKLALIESAPLVVRNGIAAKLSALVRSGRREALPPLQRIALEPVNPAVRVSGINALAATGKSEAVAPLRRSLDAGDRFVRLAAAEGLGRLRAREAVADLAGRTRDADPHVAFASLKALVRIGGADAEVAIAEIASASPENQKQLAEARAEVASH